MRHSAFGLFMGFPAAASGAISEVLYGLCKGGDIKLTRRTAGRGLRERTKLENVVERITRNLSREDMSRRLNRRLVAGTSSKIGQDTLLVVDLSDIQKRYGRSMEHLGRVRDGSSSKIGNGYWNLNTVVRRTANSVE